MNEVSILIIDIDSRFSGGIDYMRRQKNLETHNVQVLCASLIHPLGYSCIYTKLLLFVLDEDFFDAFLNCFFLNPTD